MLYSNVDFTVVYVDPSIETAGDGSTPANALKSLPASADAFTNNTCYLIRRTAEADAAVIPNGSNSNITNLLLLGMPTPADQMYEFVPEEAKTAWGADEAVYANIQSTVADGRFQLPNLRVFLMHRVYLFRNGMPTTTSCISITATNTKCVCPLNTASSGAAALMWTKKITPVC